MAHPSDDHGDLQARGSRLSRRQFLRRAACLGGSLVAGAVYEGSPSTSRAASAPKRGGVLRVGGSEMQTFWDLHGSGMGSIFNINAPVFNTLITQDPSDPSGEKLMPDLAKSWTISPDGQTYTFTLQEGVKWHDGAPFTSADVVATMEKLINPPQGVMSARKGLFGSVARVDAPNAQTVVFKLKFPDAAFLDILGIGWNVIYPKHILDKFGPKMWSSASIENKIGTGPFKFADYRLNQYVRLVRNPNYFKPGLPYLDGIEFRYIPDFTARAVALVSNTIDLYDSYPGQLQAENAQLVAQQKPKEITIGRTPLLSPIVLYTNVSKPPFDNLKVRQALSESLDRKALTDVLQEGGAVGGLVLPGSRWDLTKDEWEKIIGYGSNMQSRLAHARQLLSDAGYRPDKPLVVNLITRPSPDSERMGTFAAPMIQAIGNMVKVNIQPTTMARQAELRVKGDYEVTLNNFTQTGVDPTHLFGTYLLCNLPRNQMKLCLPEMDKLWNRQRQLTEFETRKSIVDQMHNAYLEQSAYNVLSWRYGLAGWWNFVKGFGIAPAAYTYHVRLENVWIDK